MSESPTKKYRVADEPTEKPEGNSPEEEEKAIAEIIATFKDVGTKPKLKSLSLDVQGCPLDANKSNTIREIVKTVLNMVKDKDKLNISEDDISESLQSIITAHCLCMSVNKRQGSNESVLFIPTDKFFIGEYFKANHKAGYTFVTLRIGLACVLYGFEEDSFHKFVFNIVF